MHGCHEHRTTSRAEPGEKPDRRDGRRDEIAVELSGDLHPAARVAEDNGRAKYRRIEAAIEERVLGAFLGLLVGRAGHFDAVGAQQDEPSGARFFCCRNRANNTFVLQRFERDARSARLLEDAHAIDHRIAAPQQRIERGLVAEITRHDLRRALLWHLVFAARAHQGPDIVAGIEERIHDVAPDESRAPDNSNSHEESPGSRDPVRCPIGYTVEIRTLA